MADDDFEIDEAEEELELRTKELGFKPQREIVYNKFLPLLRDEESKQWFIEIKTNLFKSVALREFRPGLIIWLSRFSKFIRFYGYKFTKEDHLSLIHFMFNLLNTDDFEPALLNKVAHALILLLKRRELLEPQDLVVNWRDVYVLYEKMLDSPYEPLRLLVLPASLENNLRDLIKVCRPYFDKEATKEILDEFRPLMCPFDTSMGKAMQYFELFLPTFNVDDFKDKSYLLWFDEFMSFWDACHNTPPWEPNVFSIFARLAENNIGKIDWEPWIPIFFSRIQGSFNLPVKYKNQANVVKSLRVDVSILSKWIVSTLGKNSSTQKYLHNLFQLMESYYHPANHGWHSHRLNLFLSKLVNCFIRRIHRERYARPKWGNLVEDEHKLTDLEITEFVKTIQPIVIHAMYSKSGLLDSGVVLQHLATIRPEIIIPPLIVRMQEALGTLTEPHKLTVCLHGIVSMARSLVYPGPKYPTGPTHVIPLLMQILPGIDPNDMKKSMVTFQFLSTFCTLVPLVDCSDAFQYYSDLTEEERVICGQTSEFEDFIIQFLERCFTLIESSGFEQTRLETSSSDHRTSMEENMKDISMATTFSSFLINSSNEIYDVALKKVKSFVSDRILETKVSGKIAASLCRSLCKSNPEKGLKAFLPYALNKIESLAKEEIQHEEHLDGEIMFNLLIVSECVRVPGEHLLPYIRDIESILKKTLHLTCKEGYMLSLVILRNLLRSFTATYPKEYRAVPDGYHRPIKEYLPIRDWGRPGYINNVNIQWHVPSSKEIEAAQKLYDEFLLEELVILNQYARKEISLTSDQILNRLTVVFFTVHGAGNCLPFWQESDSRSINVVDSLVKTESFPLVTFSNNVGLTLDGKNVRKEIVHTMDRVQKCILEIAEDDTKSLQVIVSIYQTCLLFGGLTRDDYEARSKSYNVIRRTLENKLIGNKKLLRTLIIDRVLLQHELRVLERNHIPLNEDHLMVFQNLLGLSTSHYSNVRVKAQRSLFKCMSNFSHSYQLLVPELGRLLKDDKEISHEQFKGALYIILGQGKKSMLTKHNWKTIDALWPALIQAHHSEKPSIIKVMDMLEASQFTGFDTFSVMTTIPNELVKNTLNLWKDFQSNSLSEQTSDLCLPIEIEQAEARLKLENKENYEIFTGLLEKLCDLVEGGTLTWRHYHWAFGMIGSLLRHDFKPTPRIVRIVVNNLIHENIAIRKASIYMVASILKLQKRPHKKIEVKPVSDPTKVPSVPGDRDDNLWCCYEPEKLPKSVEDWEEPRYVHKTYFGYYTWPKKMLVYASSDQQPKLNRAFDELDDSEKEIFNFFNNDSNIENLLKFLSLEEKKGFDRFDPRRFCMFKGLFRNFGDTFLPLLRNHMERLVDDATESSHRCVTEILASLIRGSKHWNFKMVSEMYEWVQPLIRVALSKISVETIVDWGTCFATASESRDPRKIAPLIQVLMEEPIRSQGSFIDSSRLYVLQGALAQQEWRIGPILYQLMDFLRPYMSHPYENVRDRIGSVLTNIYFIDLEFNDREDQCNKRSPRMKDFILEVLPKLDVLLEEDDEDQISQDTGANLMDNLKKDSALSLEAAGDTSFSQRIPPEMMGGGSPANPMYGQDMKITPPSVNSFHPLMSTTSPNSRSDALTSAMLPFPPETIPPGVILPGVVPPRPNLPGAIPPGVIPSAIPPGAIPPGVIPPGAIPPGVIPPGAIPPGVIPPGAIHPGVIPPRAIPPGVIPPGAIPPGVIPPRAIPPGVIPPGTIPAGVIPPNLSMAVMPPGFVPEAMNFKSYSSEKEKAIRLLETVCRTLSGSVMRAFNPITPDVFKLLPVFCTHESNEKEITLAKACLYTLQCLAHCVLPIDSISPCIEAIQNIITNAKSWKAKKAVLDFMQVAVFNNIPGILSRKDFVEKVILIVTEAMKNNRLEVRVKAGVILGGLLHCDFINGQTREDLMDSFMKDTKKKIKKVKETEDKAKIAELESKRNGAILKRHSAILGLCAFVNAYPYEIPEFVPEILMVLSDHLHDPVPIPVTIKKTLQDFKRTHQDNWEDHKLKFSEDQLAVLTDLLVSPSYYA